MSSTWPDHVNVDEHAVLSWRALKEILENGPQTDRLLAEMAPFKVHLSAVDVLRAVAELPGKKRRWHVADVLCDDVLERMTDRLVVHPMDDDFIYVLYENGPEHEEAGIAHALDAVSETIGIILSLRDPVACEGYDGPHGQSKFVNKVRIIDL